MGRISQYQQQGLASSLVGVVGADMSAAYALSDVSQTMASVSADMDAARKQRLLAEKAQQEILKVQRQAIFETDLAKQEMEYETLAWANAEDYKKDLDSAPNNLANWHQKYVSSVLQRYTDPVEKAKVEEALTKSYSGISKTYTNTVNTEKAKGLIADLSVASSNWNSAFAATNFNVDADTAAEMIGRRYEGNQAAYQNAYGSEWRKYWDKDNSDAIYQWFSAVAYRSPDSLKRALDSRAFDNTGVEQNKLNGVYSRAEQLQRQAVTEQRRVEREVEQDQKVTDSISIQEADDPSELRERIKNGEIHKSLIPQALRRAESLENKIETEQTKQTLAQAKVNERNLYTSYKAALGTDKVLKLAKTPVSKMDPKQLMSVTDKDVDKAYDKLTASYAAGFVDRAFFESGVSQLKELNKILANPKVNRVSVEQRARVEMMQAYDARELNALAKTYSPKDPQRAIAVNEMVNSINRTYTFHMNKYKRPPTEAEYDTLVKSARTYVMNNPKYKPTPKTALPTEKPAFDVPNTPVKPKPQNKAGAVLGAGISRFVNQGR